MLCRRVELANSHRVFGEARRLALYATMASFFFSCGKYHNYTVTWVSASNRAQSAK